MRDGKDRASPAIDQLGTGKNKKNLHFIFLKKQNKNKCCLTLNIVNGAKQVSVKMLIFWIGSCGSGAFTF